MTAPSNQTATTSGNQTSAGNMSFSKNQTALVPNTNASLLVTPTTLSPGGNLTIAGTDFAKNQQVTIMLDNETLSNGSGQVTTGTIGAFHVSITLPDDIKAGGHSISAKDSSGATVTARFNVQAPATQ